MKTSSLPSSMQTVSTARPNGLTISKLSVLGPLGWDLIWVVSIGLALGVLSGRLVGRLMLHSHGRSGQIFALQEYFVLGLIALSYGRFSRTGT